MREHVLFAKCKKCQFAFSQVEYLRHIIANGQLMTNTTKTVAVADWPEPTTIKELQQFLGLANYYHKFIKHFATIAVPLMQLLQKHVVWRWGSPQQEAFAKLKEFLINPPVLQFSSFDYEFVIETDALKVALGATLMQDIGYGLKPVQYSSKNLLPAETRYTTHDRKLLAKVATFKQFRPYIVVGHTSMATDHEPHKFMKS